MKKNNRPLSKSAFAANCDDFLGDLDSSEKGRNLTEMKFRKRSNKRPFTLLEIMIVIFLIAIIGSVIGFNMKGGLDEGRKFKTEEAMSRIKELLLLEIAKGASVDDVAANPKSYLVNAGIVKNVDKFLVDGWGKPILITKNGNNLVVRSDALTAFKNKKNAALNKSVDNETHEEDEDDSQLK